MSGGTKSNGPCIEQTFGVVEGWDDVEDAGVRTRLG